MGKEHLDLTGCIWDAMRGCLCHGLSMEPRSTVVWARAGVSAAHCGRLVWLFYPAAMGL